MESQDIAGNFQAIMTLDGKCRYSALKSDSIILNEYILIYGQGSYYLYIIYYNPTGELMWKLKVSRC